MQLTYLPAAQEDIQSIWWYTAENWGFEQADRYTNTILNICQALADEKIQGRNATLKRSYLKYPVRSHVIYFYHAGDRIEIVRVLHGSMDAIRYL